MSPAQTTTYSLNCTGAGGTATRSVTVTVGGGGVADPYAILPPITSVAPAGTAPSGTTQYRIISSALRLGYNVAFVSNTRPNLQGRAGALESIASDGSSGLVVVNLDNDSWSVRVTDPATYNTSPWYTFVSGAGTGTGTSAKFQIGDTVQTTANLNVRQTANGTVLGTQVLGSRGTIIGPSDGRPVSAGGYNWWQIDYASGDDGWSGGNYLTQAPPTNACPICP